MDQRRKGINISWGDHRQGLRGLRATGSILLCKVPCSSVSGYIIPVFPESKCMDWFSDLEVGLHQMEKVYCWLYRTLLSPSLFRAALPLLPARPRQKTLQSQQGPFPNQPLSECCPRLGGAFFSSFIFCVPFSRPVFDGGVLHQPQPGSTHL